LRHPPSKREAQEAPEEMYKRLTDENKEAVNAKIKEFLAKQ